MRYLKSRRTGEYILGLFLAPSLIGLILFYILPLGKIIEYGFDDFKNWIDVWGSQAFRNGLVNTLKFTLVYVPINLIIAFSLATIIKQIQRWKWLFVCGIIIPFVMPTGTLTYFWKVIFDYNGLLNKWLYMMNREPIYWLMGKSVPYILVIIFLHKNIGFSLFVFVVGLNLIPEEYYEYALIEGANKWQKLRFITFVYMMPTILFAGVMALLHSFNVFREVYMLFGKYPHNEIYMVQHYMVNQFEKFNLYKLSVASLSIIIPFILVIGIVMRLQHKYMKGR